MCMNRTRLNYAAAVLHLVQALVVLGLTPGLDANHANEPSFFRGVYPIEKTLFLRRNTDREPVCGLPALRNESGLTLDGLPAYDYVVVDEGALVMPHAFRVGYVDIRYMLFAFFLLSSGFQAAEAALDGPRWLRFVEYAFSAGVMLLAMAVQLGVTDIYTLCCMYALMFATNMLGLIAEMLCDASRSSTLSEWFWLGPHCLGWLTCLFAYAPLIDSYLATTRCSDRRPPGYVHVIIFLEFALFCSFGVVQLYALVQKSLVYGGYAPMAEGGLTDDIDSYADLAYIALSLTAKTLLAWLILAPILTLHPAKLWEG